MRVTISERNAPARVLRVEKGALEIGRSLANDVVLTAPSIDLRHARVVRREVGFVVHDLDSSFGIWFEGKRIRQPLVVDRGDVVWIGPYDLSFSGDEDEPGVTPARVVRELDHPIEMRFLEMIELRPFDDDTRHVYADWLEENGRMQEAEMIRVQIELKSLASGEDPRLHELSARLKLLANGLPIAWRRVVAQPAIERCDLRFELVCPKRWDALRATRSPEVRFCDGCHKHVYYAASVPEAREHARYGRCVAVDPSAPRSERDLEPRPARAMMMGAVVG
jgi:uncharacterized protein (TIGR02996 family)